MSNRWVQSRALWASTVAAVTLLAGVLVVTLAPVQAAEQGADAAAEPSAEAARQQTGEAKVVVGVYQPEVAFQSYHGRQAMMKQMRQLIGQMQQAREQQDRQKLAKMQQQIQQYQQQAVQQFQKEVEQALPKVAEQAGVDLVAVNVLYESPAVQTRNVTKQVMQKVNDGKQPAPGNDAGQQAPQQGQPQQGSQPPAQRPQQP